MEVFYDRGNDVVSIYFDVDEKEGLSINKDIIGNAVDRSYEVDEAANLILDMVDLLDERGSLKGFRVFNASKHYDLSLLNYAEQEELSGKEIGVMPHEKVIATISGD